MLVLFICDSFLLVITFGYYSLQATMELFRLPFRGDILTVNLHGFAAMASTMTVMLGSKDKK